LLSFIAEAERRALWWDEGARDLAHLLAMRYGISDWKARRWLAAAQALESLPRLSEAFSSGYLGIDKVVELTPMATPENEERLIRWAQRVPSGRIRDEAELAARRAREETEAIERERRLDWWFHDEGRRFSLVADLPAAEGAVVAGAIERIADARPASPEDDEFASAESRRADALVALAQGGGGAGKGAARPTMIIHVPVGDDAGVPRREHAGEPLTGRDEPMLTHGGFRMQRGGIIPPETLARLLCSARVQGVAEDQAGDVVRLGRISRDPPDWMVRQLHFRDHGCVFPGCGARRFAQAHHVRWWSAGGRTELRNLVLLCSTHHKLVHEFGWSLTRRETGTVRWYRPDGRRYRAGPGPPRPPNDREVRPSLQPPEQTLLDLVPA
jgi:hypothetical protein